MKDIDEALGEVSVTTQFFPPRVTDPLLFMTYDTYIIAGNPLAAVIDSADGDVNILRNKVTNGLEIEPYGPNIVAGGGSIPYQTRFQNEGVRDQPSQFSQGFVSSQMDNAIDNSPYFQSQFNDKTFLSDLFSDCPCNGDIGDGSGPNPPVQTQSGYGGIGLGSGGNGSGSSGNGGGLPGGVPGGTGGSGGGPGFGYTPPGGGPL